MKMYVVFKRKGAKEWLGALPAKPNVTKSKLEMMLKDQLRSGFTARIVNESGLKKIMMRQGVSTNRMSRSKPKPRMMTKRKTMARKRPVRRRRIMRRKKR